ncbi:MAG: hypothetical protein HUJ53_01245, partial [Holdemanella sp.]|nr:hypothetical protein [Holdemanella sp.]
MIYTYNDCLNKYGSDYLIKKEIKEGKLFQKGKGIYSDKEYCSDLEIITIKYPRAIFSSESAYYYYGLTDVIPEKYYITTKRTDSRIANTAIQQLFVNEELYDLGKTTMNYHGVTIHIYNKERLLVDLIRMKSKMPFDYYKEIINNYRRIVDDLDFLNELLVRNPLPQLKQVGVKHRFID